MPLTGMVCPTCGSFEPHALVCNPCKTQHAPYTAIRSWGKYDGPLRRAIHQLKYKNNVALADALAVHLIALFRSTGWEVDLITAVPLGLNRKRQRGYNQSSLLAIPMALALHVPYQSHAIYRARETTSQVGLSAVARRQNVQGAFAAQSVFVQGKRVVIVDDVATTGSTLTACAQALRDAGAAEVYGCTLAKSILDEDYARVYQEGSQPTNPLNQP